MQVINNKIYISRGEIATIKWAFRERTSAGTYDKVTFLSSDGTEAPTLYWYFCVTQNYYDTEPIKQCILTNDDGYEDVISKDSTTLGQLQDITLYLDSSFTNDMSVRTYYYQVGLLGADEAGYITTKIPLIEPTEFIVGGSAINVNRKP